MKTSIRNNQGAITHVLYYGRYFLTNADHLLVQQTSITKEMIEKALQDPIYELQRLVNGDDDAEVLKLYIMVKNGFDITIYDSRGEEIKFNL